MPEIVVPEIRLPKALREMSKDDIQQALADVRVPKALRELRLEDVQHALSDIKVPKVDLPEKIVVPRMEIDLRAIERRLPGRRRRRNRLPFLVIGGIALAAALWVLVTSTALVPRLRRMLEGGQPSTGEPGSVVDLADIGSASGPRPQGTDLPETVAGGRSGVAVGPGQTQRTDQDQIQPAL